jgi:hypothetical protein
MNRCRLCMPVSPPAVASPVFGRLFFLLLSLPCVSGLALTSLVSVSVVLKTLLLLNEIDARGRSQKKTIYVKQYLDTIFLIVRFWLSLNVHMVLLVILSR